MSDIIFATPSFDKAPSANDTPTSTSHKTPENSRSIELRKEEFYNKLSEASPKAGILSLLPGYLVPFDPNRHMESLPPLMTHLYRSEYLNLSYLELLNESKKVFNSLTVTIEQVKKLEQATREQSKASIWYDYRAGRVKASKMKSAAHTNPAKPSHSLINAICYPHKITFRSAATR